MPKTKLILDCVYDHEAAHPDRVYLSQPVGAGKVTDYTWAQTLEQARRMAAHLQAQGFEPGARIAILSKNCAHCGRNTGPVQALGLADRSGSGTRARCRAAMGGACADLLRCFARGVGQ